MSQTPLALRQSSHPEPPSLTAAGPGRRAERSGPEYFTVKSIFLQLTFSSPEDWHLDDLSTMLWPRGLHEWHLCGVMAEVMRDSEYCVWEHCTMVMMEVMAVLERNVSEVMTFLWPLLSSPLLSSPLLSSQLLYSTYLFSSARRSLGVDEETRREVYDQMMPAFEELFDKVEDHTLNILLEPWTLLVSKDKESSQKVTTVHQQYNSLPFYLEKADCVGQSTMGLKMNEMLIIFLTFMYYLLKNGRKKVDQLWWCPEISCPHPRYS